MTRTNVGRMYIPRSQTNYWQGSWKRFLFEFMFMRGEFLLYPNFPYQASFSTNHVEVGEHINEKDPTLLERRANFTVPLITDETVFTSLDLRTPLRPIAILDLFGKQYLETKQLEQTFQKLQSNLLLHQPKFTHSHKLWLHEERMCERFSHDVSDFMADPVRSGKSNAGEGITVVITVAFHPDTAVDQLRVLVAIPAIHHVIVLLQGYKEFITPGFFVGRVHISFVCRPKPSYANK